MLSGWLADHGYSYTLQQRYRAGNWLEAIGTGAMIAAGDAVRFEGAVYALQVQAGYDAHPGGRTALAMQGKSQYLELGKGAVATVFTTKGERLPQWFRNGEWGVRLEVVGSSFLPSGLGLVDHGVGAFSIKVSGTARAMLEAVYQADSHESIVEAADLMENLNGIRPDVAQELLERCSSARVKRLFLFLAKRAGHVWARKLDTSRIDLGRGKRSLVRNGVFDRDFLITVPRELADDIR